MHFGQAGGFAGRSYVRKSTLGELNPDASDTEFKSCCRLCTFPAAELYFCSRRWKGRFSPNSGRLSETSEIQHRYEAGSRDCRCSQGARLRRDRQSEPEQCHGQSQSARFRCEDGGRRSGVRRLDRAWRGMGRPDFFPDDQYRDRASDRSAFARALDHQHRADRRAGADRRSVLLHDVADLRERHRGIGCQASVHQRGPEERRHHILQFGSHSSLAHRRCRRAGCGGVDQAAPAAKPIAQRSGQGCSERQPGGCVRACRRDQPRKARSRTRSATGCRDLATTGTRCPEDGRDPGQARSGASCA